MKKLLLSSVLSLLVLGSFAQSEKYMSAMKDKVASADTTRDVQSLKDLSAAFERIGDAEKTQWLPYYYAALTQVNAGYMTYIANPGNPDALSGLDAIAERSEQLLTKAEAMTK